MLLHSLIDSSLEHKYLILLEGTFDSSRRPIWAQIPNIKPIRGLNVFMGLYDKGKVIQSEKDNDSCITLIRIGLGMSLLCLYISSYFSLLNHLELFSLT